MEVQMPHNPMEINERVAVIRVIGVGGGGSNAVDRMIADGVQNVDFITVNTDAQALQKSVAPTRIRIGDKLTKGLGAGNDPIVGEKAAEESASDLIEALRGADMVFVTAGMGGGTGTGAAPVIARLANELGILTVAVVTRPFDFEGRERRKQSERGIERLRPYVDTLVVVPNQRLLTASNKTATLQQAFQLADSVLRQGIQGIADMINLAGLINVDFADVRSVMQRSGSALMSIGIGNGENRLVDAVKEAIESPLLEVTITGARSVLMNVTGGEDLTLFEVQESATIIEESVAPDANIIWGLLIDPNFPRGQVKVTLIATGFEDEQKPVAPPPPAAKPPVRNESAFYDGRRPISGSTPAQASTPEPAREQRQPMTPFDAAPRDVRPAAPPAGAPSTPAPTRQQSQPLVTSSSRTSRTSQPLRNLPSAKDVDLPTFVRSRIDKDRSGN
jgi:cell division protein FtsZ